MKRLYSGRSHPRSSDTALSHSETCYFILFSVVSMSALSAAAMSAAAVTMYLRKYYIATVTVRLYSSPPPVIMQLFIFE